MIKLPNAGYPKPGEKVVWFSKNRMTEGKLLGFNIYENPIIINEFDLPDSTGSFKTIRPKDPYNRIDANWNRMPTGGLIVDASQELITGIEAKLNERIPPGPSYFEVINEMFYRGYETYLVGGTVRDFIQGDKSNDIDLVTTMPLKSAIPLLKSMFGKKVSYNRDSGFIRVGGSPASGDPFIDIKNFLLCHSGIGSTIFGSEIEQDLKIRDFACNSLYYDPVNKKILDPSGIGVRDAESKTLTLVKDLSYSNPHYTGGQIVIRFVKFIIRGYSASEETMIEVKKEFCPLFSTMYQEDRVQYIMSQILNKHPRIERLERYNFFVLKMKECGFEEEYERYIAPLESLINFS